jgi:hypothetical protein
VALSDPKDACWRLLRGAVLSAVLRRKRLVAAPGIVSAAAEDESLAQAWKRVSAVASPAPRVRWQWWRMWRRSG